MNINIFLLCYNESSLLPHVIKHIKWGISYNDKDKYLHLPIIKVWSGR
jgi:hypothetical protein